MKLLLFGGSGLLGRAVRQRLPGEWAAFCPPHGECDLCEEGAAQKALEQYQPDAVLNCAAMTNVDRCEKEPELAFFVNCKAVKRLSSACEKAGVPLYHIGTDYVFDGTADAPIPEDAAPNPVNVYGKSKLAGEQAVLTSGGCVLRVQWLYGHGKSAFVDRILNASEDDPVNVVEDCFGIPTFANDVADMLFALMHTGEKGLFHGACMGFASWLDFAREILAQTGVRRKLLPVPAESLKRPAMRPKYTVLDTGKLQKLCALRPWRKALADYLAQKNPAGG